jgi:hypothetical protein
MDISPNLLVLYLCFLSAFLCSCPCFIYVLFLSCIPGKWFVTLPVLAQRATSPQQHVLCLFFHREKGKQREESAVSRFDAILEESEGRQSLDRLISTVHKSVIAFRSLDDWFFSFVFLRTQKSRQIVGGGKQLSYYVVIRLSHGQHFCTTTFRM